MHTHCDSTFSKCVLYAYFVYNGDGGIWINVSFDHIFLNVL